MFITSMNEGMAREMCWLFAVIHLSSQPGLPSYVPKRPTMFQKREPVGGGLADPGWVPMKGGQRQQVAPQPRRYAPLGPVSAPINRPGRAPQQLTPPPPPPQPSRDLHWEPPAWVGSLRHSGGPRPWEMAEAEQLMGGGRAGYRGPAQTAVGISENVCFTFKFFSLFQLFSSVQLSLFPSVLVFLS